MRKIKEIKCRNCGSINAVFQINCQSTLFVNKEGIIVYNDGISPREGSNIEKYIDKLKISYVTGTCYKQADEHPIVVTFEDGKVFEDALKALSYMLEKEIKITEDFDFDDDWDDDDDEEG